MHRENKRSLPRPKHSEETLGPRTRVQIHSARIVSTNLREKKSCLSHCRKSHGLCLLVRKESLAEAPMRSRIKFRIARANLGRGDPIKLLILNSLFLHPHDAWTLCLSAIRRRLSDALMVVYSGQSCPHFTSLKAYSPKTTNSSKAHGRNLGWTANGKA